MLVDAAIPFPSTTATRSFMAPPNSNNNPSKKARRGVFGWRKFARKRRGAANNYGATLERESSRIVRSFHADADDDVAASLRDEADLLPEDDDDSEESSVAAIEWGLRQALVIFISYCCGVWYPVAYPYIKWALEYVTVAWVTCLAIIILSYWKRQRRTTREEHIPLLQPQDRQLVTSQDAIGSYEDIESPSARRRSVAALPSIPQPHPALGPFYVMDTLSGERIVPNSKPYPIDNDLFHGHMMLMMRTPNVDNPSAAVGTPENAPFEDFFSNKQRRWEIQFQIKLKKPKPAGKLYFATELSNVVPMGFVQKTMVTAAMGFVKKRSSNFHYSLTGDNTGGPYMAFGLEEGMLRIIATKPGKEPPTLGSTLEESAESIKKRFKTGIVNWNTEDTFTLSFWTAYFDYLDWKAVNLPGIRPFSLRSVVGPQHISMRFYLVPDNEATTQDDQLDRTSLREYVNLEFSNATEMDLGPVARQWIAQRQQHTSSVPPMVDDVAPPLMPHPALEKFYVIDTLKNRRGIPNSLEPFEIENDFFIGKGMLMLRTPDVDDASAPRGTPENSSVVEFFNDKQRRWELQFQVKFKKVPDGKLFFGCDLEEPVNLGIMQMAFVSAAMAFVKQRSNNFHYRLGGDEPPYMAFGLEEGMLRIIASKAGEEPPKLGSVLVEDPESVKRRFKTGIVNWNTEDTFTMSFWTAYFDFLDWKTVNFPGVRPFSLRSVVGPQHFNIRFYMVPKQSQEGESDGKHDRSQAVEFVNLEFSNKEEIDIGPGARRWIAENKKSKLLGEDASMIGTVISGDESILFENEQQEETIAELGEGLYLRSGDPILLNVSNDDVQGFVASGGDFAIVQRQASSTVVFEKARRHSSTGEGLIRSGDEVMIKLIVSKSEVKYLSIHRGWWLKWVSHAPKTNGFFTIHTTETDVGPDGQALSPETQGSFVTIGGTFLLKHKKWRGRVGIRSQESATYGGRLLGLYESSSPCIVATNSADTEGPELEDESEGEDAKWMNQVVFTAIDIGSIKSTTPTNALEDSNFSFDALGVDMSKDDLYLTAANCSLDVPVWIDMMHRTQKRRQLAYVVRVIVEGDETATQEGDDSPEISTTSFCRLRSGRTLAQVIRAGLGGTKQQPAHPSNQPDGSSIASNSILAMSDDDDAPIYLSDNDDEDRKDASGVERDRKKRKGLKFMDKFADTVKLGTAKTGKGIAKHSKKVGKGTVSAGKAIISPIKMDRAKKPPSKEPKTLKIVTPDPLGDYLKKKGDMGAIDRTLKRIKRKTSTMNWLSEPNVVAGQLSAPEQSLRTTSHALSRMSDASPASPLADDFEVIANDQFVQPSELDKSFLEGGAAQIFVVPPDRENLIHGSLVARCRWESHWREEWCGIYKGNIMFFASMSKRPVVQIEFGDISAIRSKESNEFSPLPGYSILVVETDWQCYYFAFSSESGMESFKGKLEEQLFFFNQESEESIPFSARFWQGCQDLLDLSNSPGDHKWAKLSCGGKLVRRVVLNGRRATFDVESLEAPAQDSELETHDIESFVSKLLDLALATSFDTVERDGDKFIEFLDMTSRLKTLPLNRLDLSDASVLCIFVNLYHCLLQLALLLTVKGSLNKKSNINFMRTNCFEVGGDIFSLAELYHCVIRGHMSKPNSPKPPYLEVPKKSLNYNYAYALSHADPRINFVLHTGAVSWPQKVRILRPSTLTNQLQQIASAFCERNLVVDHSKRTIYLPKVCDVYRKDFGSGDVLSCFGFCVGLNDRGQDLVQLTTEEDPPYSIKFASNAEKYHQLLARLDDDVGGQDETLTRS